MLEGQEAPFDGILYTNELAAEVTAELDGSEKRHEEEIVYEKEQCGLLIKNKVDLMKIDSGLFDQKEGLLRQALDEQAVWYRQPLFVAAITAALTIGLVVVSAHALDSVN